MRPVIESPSLGWILIPFYNNGTRNLATFLKISSLLMKEINYSLEKSLISILNLGQEDGFYFQPSNKKTGLSHRPSVFPTRKTDLASILM